MKITRQYRSPKFDEILIEGSILDQYKAQQDIYENLLKQLNRAAVNFRKIVGNRRIWHINSTAFGGGVAEMLPSHIVLLRELGFDVRWLVFKPEAPGFFRFTKGVHNSLHNKSASKLGLFYSDYVKESKAGAVDLADIVNEDDFLFVHDPQPLHAVSHLLLRRPQPALWRCHIGYPESTPVVDGIWQLLSRFLQPFHRIVLSDELYSFNAPAHIDYIQPSICPFSKKNRVYLEKPDAALDDAVYYADDEGQRTPKLRALFETPYFLHVSRWDALKGIDRVIHAFDHYIRNSNGDAGQELRLVIAGPDPRGVADDPEGYAYFDHCRSIRDKLRPDIRNRVVMACVSMEDANLNAEIIGRMQQNARCVFQLSRQEGFGLTTTEALFRGRPLVVSDALGLKRQVTDGVNGRVIAEPHIEEKAARLMQEIVEDPHKFEQMGAQAMNICIASSIQISKIPQWMDSISEAVKSFERSSARLEPALTA